MPELRGFSRKRAWFGVGLCLSTIAVFWVISAWQVAAASSVFGSHEFSAETFQEHVRFLANDGLKGRGNGTPEQQKAAAYIARWFKKAGLDPAGDSHTYFQRFTMTTGAKLGTRNALSFSDSSGVKTLKVERDFIPFSFSANGKFDASLVFAGYGITAPDLQYDDYQGIDAKDKIVIVLRHEPQEDDDHSVFAGRQLTTHSAIVNKAINAKNHGAAGMILVNDMGAHAEKGDELIGFKTL